MVRVYIVDERADIRSALAECLARADCLDVIGHAGEVAQVMADVSRMKPELVLMEIKRSDGMGLEMLRQVSEAPEKPKTAVLTSYPSTWERDAAARAGAIAYLMKDIDSEDLVQRIFDLAAS